MNSRLGIFLLTLLCLPTVASAAIININYTAHIYAVTGDGMGYKEGDLISGIYVIDTSKADGKTLDEPNEASYYGSVFSGFIQSSFASPPTMDYSDHLDVYNNSPVFGDMINITKTLNSYDFTLELLGTSFRYLNLDWIFDTELGNTNLSADEGGYSNGMFARFDVNDWTITDSANFWLDSVTITSDPSSVPEPTPLVLLSIAVAGLIIRRRVN